MLKQTMARGFPSGGVAFVLLAILAVAGGESGPRSLEEGDVVGGDGRTEWLVGDFTIVIPNGMRLQMGGSTTAPERMIFPTPNVAAGSWESA